MRSPTITLVLILLTCSISQSQNWPEISFSSPITGFNMPVQITHAGDNSGRLFISEQKGLIRILKNGTVFSMPFLNLTARIGAQGHLHGIAFPPNYASKGHFYVKYTSLSCNIIVARYRLTANSDVADPNSEQIILSFNHAVPGTCGHSGGPPAFSPTDGYLYFSTGDGSPGEDPNNLAQDPQILLGKMVRIDVETGNPSTYTIPPTNPFNGTPGYLSEIWALGLRNPWRFSFDRETADLYIGDVGQTNYEEVDYQAAASTGGENYGWRAMEGAHCHDAGCDTTGLTLPIVEYDHTQGCSVTGGFVYRGASYPSMQGIYFYGDYCNGSIWGLRQQSGTWQTSLLANSTLRNVVSFGEDEGGELFVADHNSGVIYRIRGIAPAPTDLSITMTDSPDPVAANSQLTYAIQVTNGSSSEATGLIVTDNLPTGVSFVSATSSMGNCSRSGSTVKCLIPGMPSGATDSIIVIVKPPAAGTLTNTASVIGNEPDPNTTNNSVTNVTSVYDTVQFSAGSYSVFENAGIATITVTRLGSSTLSVDYATSENTAAAGSDYTTVSGRLTFAASEGSKSFTVPITSDMVAEGNESLNLTLTSPSGAVLGQNDRAILTITDDDTLVPPLELRFTANPPPPNNTCFAFPAGISMVAKTEDINGVVTQVEFYADATLLFTDNTSPYSFNWTGAPPGIYSLTARAKDNNGAVTISAPVSITVSTLPDQWLYKDVGSVGVAGNVCYLNSVYTMKASGVDIWGTADAFQYVYRTLSGDGEIVARVFSVQNTHSWAKAGVMFRESLSPDSKNASMVITSRQGASFQRRISTGGASTSTAGGSGAAPYWVRLVRSGGTFTGYKSSNGTSWTLVGTATISMVNDIYVGLALSSHANFTLCTAKIDSVNITGSSSNQTPNVSITAPTNGAVINTPGSVAINATATDNDGSVSKVEFYVNGTFLAADNTSPYSVGWNHTTPGSYSLTAKAFDNQGATKLSNAVGVTLNGNSPPTVSLTSPVTGTTFTAPATISLNATASDDGNVMQVDFYSNGALVGSDPISPYSFTWGNVPSGNYTLVAKAIDNLSVVSESVPSNVMVTTGGGSLPQPWQNQDIGSVGLAGSANFLNSVFTLNGSGADIWGKADAFHFVHRTLSGDGEIVARVSSVQNTNVWAKSGVMIRESLTAGSRHALMAITPGRGARFQYRNLSGGTSAEIYGGNTVAPYWVRLVRVGNVFTAYKSANGSSWIQVGSTTLSMPGNVYIGLALTSHDNSVLSTSNVDNVTVIDN